MNTLETLQDIARLAQQGKLDEAQARCIALLEASPGNVDAHGLLGMILSNMGRYAEAVPHLKALVNAGVKDANVFYDLADALTSSGQFSEAVEYYVQAIRFAPDWPELHFNLGFVMQCLERHENAVQNYRNALRLRPDWVDAHNNIGLELIELDRPDEAVEHYRRALAVSPNHINATNNLGLALADLGRFDEAIDSYRRAIALKPDYFEAHNNLGVSLLELRRYDDALGEFRASTRINPAYHRAIFNESIALLSLGNLTEGFRKYESRWNTPKFPALRPQLDCPQWLGDEDLAGKSIFVFAEQGFGDTLQFCRYLPLLADKAARVTVAVPGILQGLVGNLDARLTVVTPDAGTAGHDFNSPLCSLPLAFHTSAATIPFSKHYLAAPPGSAEKFRDLRTQGGVIHLGICWRSGSRHRLMRKRDVPLAALLAALQNLPGQVKLFSLQKDISTEEQALLAGFGNITDLGSRLDDFSDTAAAVSMMDQIISVDTAVAHLCGAMGIPVLIMLMFSPDWRWLPDSERSQWYPGARLLRQNRIGDWTGVMRRVAEILPSVEVRQR
jgi:tetratricopeptide (TPR) repeat protein